MSDAIPRPAARTHPEPDGQASDATSPTPQARRERLRARLDELTGELSLQAVREHVALLQSYQRRVHRWFTISAALGLSVGLGVAALHVVIQDLLLERLLRRELWPLLIVLPTLGLLLAHQALRLLPGPPEPDTTERYIAAFHRPRERLRLRDLWARLLATILTIGTGGSLGLEGPSVLTGASVGAHLQARFSRLFAGEDARLLMVAGAAAGISAIFRAPVTGLIFSLEVPFKDDIARHAVLPALVASATGYLGQAVVFGTTPLLPVELVPRFTPRDLLLTIVVGAACGLTARAFVRLLHTLHRATRSWPALGRILAGGALTSAAGLGSVLLVGRPDALGIGYDAIRSIAEFRPPYHLAWVLALFLVLKALATSGTLVGGGAGGIFIPLVLMGATVGGLCVAVANQFVPGLDAALFPLVGIAAFLGAGYHTPLAAVAFVAETTGSSNYIVAGLLAAAFAYGVIGNRSVSQRQRTARRGRVEVLLEAPVSTVLGSPPIAVGPDTSLEAFAREYLLSYPHREYPVAAEGLLLGMVRLDHLTAVDSARWEHVRVVEVMDRDCPAVQAEAPLRMAAEIINRHGLDRVPVVDREGRVVGILGPRDVFRLGEVLDDIHRSAS